MIDKALVEQALHLYYSQHLSFREVANLLHVSHMTVSNWVNKYNYAPAQKTFEDFTQFDSIVSVIETMSKKLASYKNLTVQKYAQTILDNCKVFRSILPKN